MELFDIHRQTDEHIFPTAIGGTLILRDVCKDCNDYLGSNVDVRLTDHPLIVDRRKRFSLVGHSGRWPSFSIRGTLEENGTTTDVIWKSDTFRRLPLQRTTETGKELILDPSDADRIPTIQKKHKQRKGNEHTTVRAADDVIRGVVSFSLPTLQCCEPALLKIAYELACDRLGSGFLDEPSALAIRNFLRSPMSDITTSGISGLFRGGPEVNKVAGVRDEHLVGGLKITNRETWAYVRIFNVVEGYVKLSERAFEELSPSGFAVILDVSRGGAAPKFTTFQ